MNHLLALGFPGFERADVWLSVLLEFAIKATLVLALAGDQTQAEEITESGDASNEDHLDFIVARFNEEARESRIGKKQPPVTRDEVVAAIREHLDRNKGSETQRKTLEELLAGTCEKQDISLRRFTRYDDGAQFQEVWWVWLFIPSKTGPSDTIPIRESTLFTRPFSQMERNHNFQDGVTLIGRLVGYFEADPSEGPPVRVIPQEKARRLIDDFEWGIASENVDDLLSLFHWNQVSAATREFVTREMRLLLNSDIEHARFIPRGFAAELLHWQAFQRYKPNLPHVGYLDITYTWKETRRRLSLEVGESKDGLKLLSYTEDGEPKFPQALGAISMSGGMAMIEGAVLMYTNIEQPGELLSGRLAHEEIWRRELDPETGALKPHPDIDSQESVESDEDDRDADLSPAALSGPRVPALDREVLEWLELDLKVGDSGGLPTNESTLFRMPMYHPNRPQDLDIGPWLKCVLDQKIFFIEVIAEDAEEAHRSYGPYKGDPFVRLGLLDAMTARLRSGIASNDAYRVGLMLRSGNPTLITHALGIIKETLEYDGDLSRVMYHSRSFQRGIKKLEDGEDPLIGSETWNQIQAEFARLPARLEERTVSHPISSYIHAKDARQAPDSISEVAWGEPQHGLRLALIPVNPEAALPLGRVDRVLLVIENTGSEVIRFSLFGANELPQLNVREEAGKRLLVHTVFISIKPVLSRYVLQPGERIEVSNPRFSLERSGTDPQLFASAVHFEEDDLSTDGTYYAWYQLPIGLNDFWIRGKDGILMRDSPGKGEWVGTLTSGAVSFRIRED